MIKVKNLYKIYTDGTPTNALDDVSFTLGDTGMVFIIGKSGSGKSTLLNILAGFDTPTKGDIYVGNEKLNDYTPIQLDCYRNSAIGFVFQDFCLIETLTVSQNIKMSLDLQNIKLNSKQIDDVLKSVSMEKFNKRLPRQLSAGQKQRVAIARALIKKPSIILADEPTGNLDSKTTSQILDLLKEISKERLVIVVSHNKDDALKYADRIIEIGGGKIIFDKTKNNEYINEYSIDGNNIILPNKKRLTSRQLTEIDKTIKKYKGKVHFKKCIDEFSNSENKDIGSLSFTFKKTSMGFKNLLKYSWLFFKHQLFVFFLIVAMVVLLITTLSISIQFANYDGNLQYTEAINKSNTDIIALRQDKDVEKIDESSEYMYEIDNESIDKLQKQYGFDFYKVYNYNFPIQTDATSSFIWPSNQGYPLRGNIVSKINSLVECDIQLLIDKFADENGELNYIGDISSSSNGIIITDLVADTLLNYYSSYHFTSYQQIIESDYLFNRYGVKVVAIIDTEYSLESFLDNSFIEKYSETDYRDLMIYSYIVAYTTNPEYFTNYKNEYCKNIYQLNPLKFEFVVEDKVVENSTSKLYFNIDSVKEDEIIIDYTIYNYLFNTDLTLTNKEGFKVENITLNVYDTSLNAYYKKQFKIVDITNNGYNYINSNEKELLLKDQYYQTGIYLKNLKDISSFLDSIEQYDLYISNSRMSFVSVAVSVVAIFSDLFALLSIILCISIIVLVILNAINTLNKNIYTIGVSRSMGAHISELGFIYSLQMVLFVVLVIILSNISVYYSTNFINDVLMHTIPNVIALSGSTEITYLFYNPLITAICTGLVTLLTIVSIFIPLISIKLLNPVNIIKSR